MMDRAKICITDRKSMRTINRREMLALTASAAVQLAARPAQAQTSANPYDLVAATDRSRILAAADRYLAEQPITVTASHSKRSKGGAHDYFSEGDYWWPDEK